MADAELCLLQLQQQESCTCPELVLHIVRAILCKLLQYEVQKLLSGLQPII